MTKQQEFLLAVRRLEKQYGIYLSTSEWMSCTDVPPADDRYDGVFSAVETVEATLELIAAAAAAAEAKEPAHTAAEIIGTCPRCGAFGHWMCSRDQPT